DLSTSSFNNVFNEKPKVTAKLITNEETKKLKIDPIYDRDKKNLRIIIDSPLDISDFEEGTTVIINYSLKAGKDSGIKQAAPQDNYNIGRVDFTLETATPVCSIVSRSKTYYTGNIPSVIYNYLPDVLASFDAYHTISSADNSGIMKGSITLVQVGDNNFNNRRKVDLSNLGLDDCTNERIVKSKSSAYVEVEAVYGFDIPINLDQFNVD
ncbi:MAG: hypothetical protein GX076_05630, partial [Clostridiales bacterium]|nr:hypothetical protein [Clostridiales bacterium]